jgi:hypothetical protein
LVDVLKAVGTVLAVAGIAFPAIYTVVYQFAHPEMTRTQLIMELWPYYLAVFIAAVALSILSEV